MGIAPAFHRNTIIGPQPHVFQTPQATVTQQRQQQMAQYQLLRMDDTFSRFEITQKED